MEDLLGTTVITEGGATQPLAEAFSGVKYVGLYFGAHWAPCCRRFTEQMKEDYVVINKPDQQKELELVFVSKDGNQAAFDRNFAEMPWKAVKYDDEARKKSLEQKYGIMEIPMLIIVKAEDGSQTSDNGIRDLMSHRGDVIEHWDKCGQAGEAGAAGGDGAAAQ